MPDEFILDVDGKNVDVAINKSKGLILLLNELDIPYKIFFSGTEFHFNIPSDAFRWKPAIDLHLKVKHALNNAGVFEYADSSVTDKVRLIRVPNTKNTKSNLYKVQITEILLNDKDKLFKCLISFKCNAAGFSIKILFTPISISFFAILYNWFSSVAIIA